MSSHKLDWHGLSSLTQGKELIVERVRLVETGIAIEGGFELPKLAQLSIEDQVFVMAFVHCHGSIKEMEQIFGVSYPTIKSRLNKIGGALAFVDANPRPSQQEILDKLERGEITAEETVKKLEALK